MLAQDALDLWLVVDAVVDDLRGHHFTPPSDKLKGLLADLLDLQ